MPDTRLLLITSPLGAGELIATRLGVTEEVGLPYEIDVEVQSAQHELQAKDLLTKPITVTVARKIDGAPVERHFHGLVSAFQRLPPRFAGFSTYRLIAVPGLWRLGLKRNCRIFHQKSVRDIVGAVLSEHGLPAPTWGIVGSLQPILYCTQFNETDLAFCLRLLEEHGLGCYFTHTAAAHTLCISGTAQGFPMFVRATVQATHNDANDLELSSWQRLNRARSASVKLLDMDTERSQPSVVLSKNKSTVSTADEPAMWAAGEVFSWPGGMSTRNGLDPAAVLMGALETQSEEFSADAADPRFSAGVRVSVEVASEDGSAAAHPCAVLAVRHSASDLSGLVSGTGAVEHYQGSLELVRSDRTWMPTARHARPVLAGLHSARVTGPSGEKIHVDAFGRIRVKFRWDRAGADDDSSSCWVRVAQSAAGSWGGTWFLPRVGDEVLVAFLEGDPDRPIVTGSVYGKDSPPPFDPGANRSQSGIRTRSYKSDSSDDANILRFEDKKGSEEVLLHAQKDLNVKVEHARDVVIMQSHDTLTVEQGNLSTTVSKGSSSHTVSLGDMTIKCDAGSVTIEAMQKITLKVGSSTVVIDQMGVTTKGTMITEEAQAMHKTKAAMLQEEASAMVQVQGGIVMIN
jgi:type VI secretion system secreted protein VgrG